MNHFFRFIILVVAVACFSCSPASRGKSAGNEYCKCDHKDGIMEIGKCKKEVLKKHKEDLTNLEFQDAFWAAVGDCE